MITLFGMSSPNVQKIQLMLEETGLPYGITRVDVWKGENFDPAFAALNPNRKVPVIVDPEGPDGEPVTVFESGAILIYLAEKTGQFLPAKGAARYQVLEWLAVQMCGVGPMFGQYTHFRNFAPKGNEYAESRYRTQAVRLFEAIEERLAAVPYLGGADYSVADMATFPWMRNRAEKWGGDWSRFPSIWRWFDRVAGRPAAQRMVAEMDRIWQDDVASINAAPVPVVDRLLGRGAFAN